MSITSAMVEASLLGLTGPNTRRYVPPKRLRQVANNCRYPNTSLGLRQYFGMSKHIAGADLGWLTLGHYNAYGYQEIQGAGTLHMMWGLECPVGRDDLQFFYYNNSEFGQNAPGGVLFSDGLWLDQVIPKGAAFKLWTYIYSTASGIPGSFSGPQPFTNGAATHGLAVQSGSSTTNIDYFLTNSTSAQRNALVNNGTITQNVQVTPMCILSDADVRAFGFWGDSRSAGQSSLSPFNFDYVSDASLKQCVLERVFGDLAPWINFSASQDSMANMTVSGGGRRNEFLKFVTDVVNGLGTNDIDSAASDAVMQAYDATFASMRNIAGKRLWGVTIPPKTTSTNQFIDAAGQTVSTGNARRVTHNAYRKNAAMYGGRVIDFDSVADPTASGKYQGNGRVFSATIASGSNVVSGSGFLASENGKTIAINGAGASGAVLVGRQVYVDANTINLVDAVTGLAVTASTAVTGAVAYANCRENTADGTHETQALCKAYEAALKPVAAALY